MTEMFLTIKKNGQEIAFSSEEVENLIDQLDDMMGELALMEESEKDSIPEEIPVDMPSVESKPEPKKSSPAELCSFFLGL